MLWSTPPHLFANRPQRQGSRQAVQAPPLTLGSVRPPGPAVAVMLSRYDRSNSPPVLLASLPAPPAEESQRVHRHRCHLFASLLEYKVRFALHLVLRSLRPPPQLPAVSANSFLSEEYLFPVLGGPPCKAGTMRPTQSRKRVGVGDTNGHWEDDGQQLETNHENIQR